MRRLLFVMILVANMQRSSATCILHIIDAMHKVGVNASTADAPSDLQVPLAAAQGELVHMQVVLDAQDGATEVNVTATFGGGGGGGGTAIRVRQVFYHHLNLTFAPAANPGWYPDALVDPPFAIDRQWPATVFWLSFRVPATTAPGTHRAAVSAATWAAAPAAGGAPGSTCAAQFDVAVADWTMPSAPTQQTGAQFEHGAIEMFSVPKTYDPDTAFHFFESLAAQRASPSPWFQLADLPWGPSYRFNENLTAVTLNTSAHDAMWPKVLELFGSTVTWRMPFTLRFFGGEGALPHLLPNNVTWWFTTADGNRLHVPVFAAPYNGTLNPEFERMFTVLFTAVVDYLDSAAKAWPGGPDSGLWVQIIDEPTWTDPATLSNTLAMMRLYKRVSPRIKIYQTRFPEGTEIPTNQLPLLSLVDWWAPHVCQWIDGATPARLATLRAQRNAANREFHATVRHNKCGVCGGVCSTRIDAGARFSFALPTFVLQVYDNGVPIIEAPNERVRFQALDVWASNGTLDGTLSWYSVNSYGKHGTVYDPWLDPMPSPKHGKISDPAGWGFLLWPPQPDRRGAGPWAPVESIRWVQLGAGLQDAEYLYALAKRAPSSPAARALLAQARSMATQFPSHWNNCVGRAEQGWGDDGYLVDTGNETNGSSVVNDWKLAMGAELSRVAERLH